MIATNLRGFAHDRRGAAMAEAAFAIPAIFLLFAGVFALGSTLYNAQLIDTTARDASRYLARVDNPASQEAIARNLAVFANTAGSGAPRVPGLTIGDVAISYVDTPNPINPLTGQRAHRGPDPIRTVQVQIAWRDTAGGLFSLFGFQQFQFTSRNQQRGIGE